MATQRRWECPNGCGGVLGPGKMRRDDARRFCLECTARTGRLVERTCPALERERDERQARREAKRKATRERERARWRARYVIDVVEADGTTGKLDVLAFVDVCRRLRAVRDVRDGRLPSFPSVGLYRRAFGASGKAWPRHIHLSIGLVPREQAEELILHEVMHVVLPGERHGSVYRCALLAAAWELWPECRGVQNEGKCYAMDERIWKAVRDARKVKAGVWLEQAA